MKKAVLRLPMSGRAGKRRRRDALLKRLKKSRPAMLDLDPGAADGDRAAQLHRRAYPGLAVLPCGWLDGKGRSLHRVH